MSGSKHIAESLRTLPPECFLGPDGEVQCVLSYQGRNLHPRWYSADHMPCKMRERTIFGLERHTYVDREERNHATISLHIGV